MVSYTISLKMFHIKLTAADNKIVYTANREGKKLKSVSVEWEAPDGKRSEVSAEAKRQLFQPTLAKAKGDKPLGKYQMTVPCLGNRVCFLKLSKDGSVKPKMELTEASGKTFPCTLDHLVAHVTVAPPSMTKLVFIGKCIVNGKERIVKEELLVTEEMMAGVNLAAIMVS